MRPRRDRTIWRRRRLDIPTSSCCTSRCRTPQVEEAHYIRVYMRQLRNKLEENPARPRYLLMELGVGYRE